MANRAQRHTGCQNQPMTPRHPRAQGRWWRFLLAAVVAAWTVLGLAGTASATAVVGAETRVGASTESARVFVGASDGVCAGQRLGETAAGPQIASATGVAAKSADEFVDLASASRRSHILDGEVRPNGTFGGGHRPGTGFPGTRSGGGVDAEFLGVEFLVQMGSDFVGPTLRIVRYDGTSFLDVANTIPITSK